MEHKYRVWDKLEQRMIVHEQDFIPLMVTNRGVFRLDHSSKAERWIFIDPERFEVMQYAGIQDKYGVDIYEGDKVRLIANFEDLQAWVKLGQYDQDGSGGEYGPEKCIGFHGDVIGKHELDEDDFRKVSEYQYYVTLLNYTVKVIGHRFEQKGGGTMGHYSEQDIKDMRETMKVYGDKSEEYYEKCSNEQIIDQYEKKAGVRE